MINSLHPMYQLPYGCGTIAIHNARNHKGQYSDLDKIKALLKERNKISLVENMSAALKALKMSFDFQEVVEPEVCLTAIKGGSGVILLHFDNASGNVGHYTFFFKNKANQIIEVDKLSTFTMFKALASKKSPEDKKPALAWIIY